LHRENAATVNPAAVISELTSPVPKSEGPGARSSGPGPPAVQALMLPSIKIALTASRSQKSTTPGVTEKMSRCHPGLIVVAKPNANCFSVRRHTRARAATIMAIHLKLVIESVSFIETALKRHCTSRAIGIKASPSLVHWACREILGRYCDLAQIKSNCRFLHFVSLRSE
jgi:hypothetical protein